MFLRERRCLHRWGSLGQPGSGGLDLLTSKGPRLLKPTPTHTKGLCQEPGQGWEPETQVTRCPAAAPRSEHQSLVLRPLKGQLALRGLGVIGRTSGPLSGG